jgi:UDP-N-acetyl-D-glucosamine dehydrogenase
MIVREIGRMPVSFESARILILGVAFKRDVDDIRHSPALKVMELMQAEGAGNIAYNDPHVPLVEVGGKQYRSTTLTGKAISEADCVIITTDHSSYDYDLIVRQAKRVIDTRNATKGVAKGREKIVLLGNGRQDVHSVIVAWRSRRTTSRTSSYIAEDTISWL